MCYYMLHFTSTSNYVPKKSRYVKEKKEWHMLCKSRPQCARNITFHPGKWWMRCRSYRMDFLSYARNGLYSWSSLRSALQTCSFSNLHSYPVRSPHTGYGAVIKWCNRAPAGSCFKQSHPWGLWSLQLIINLTAPCHGEQLPYNAVGRLIDHRVSSYHSWCSGSVCG